MKLEDKTSIITAGGTGLGKAIALEFANAGADIITVHIEACPYIHRVVQKIKDEEVKAGVSLNPGTPIDSLTDILSSLDFEWLKMVQCIFPVNKRQKG